MLSIIAEGWLAMANCSYSISKSIIRHWSADEILPSRRPKRGGRLGGGSQRTPRPNAPVLSYLSTTQPLPQHHSTEIVTHLTSPTRLSELANTTQGPCIARQSPCKRQPDSERGDPDCHGNHPIAGQLIILLRPHGPGGRDGRTATIRESLRPLSRKASQV